MTILQEMAAEDAKNRKYFDWVSVKDHKPSESGTYLVCTTKKAVFISHYNKELDIFSSTAINKRITHWADKPEPAED